MKKKKLLILVNDLSFFISHRLPIAEISLTKGYNVVIGYGDYKENDEIKLLKDKGFELNFIPMHRGGINLLSNIKSFFNIWKFFKKEQPNIVHLITIKPYLYGGIISRLTGVPALVSAISGLGTLFIDKNLKGIFFRLLLYPIFKIAFNHSNQKIIVQNKDDLKVLVEWGILKSTKAKLIKGSGTNLEDFKNFDEPKGIPTVCFAARLLRSKGVYDFIAAAKLIRERGIKARFLLAGYLDNNNPSGLSLDDLNRLKKEANIEFLGFEKNIPTLYAKSNIISLPSYYGEGLPKSLIEAAAASRAIVTTDSPGCRDAIIPNKTGLLVPIKNPQKLADAIEWLIKNPKERISMGKAGRKFAEKEFKIEKIIENHLDIYQELLSKTKI